jgi:hypothetical protein
VVIFFGAVSSHLWGVFFGNVYMDFGVPGERAGKGFNARRFLRCVEGGKFFCVIAASHSRF